MASQIVYTSSLPPDLMNFVQKEASIRKCTKKTIIIEALKDYKSSLKKAKMAKSFKQAAKDPEMQELAETGLEDYLKA